MFEIVGDKIHDSVQPGVPVRGAVQAGGSDRALQADREREPVLRGRAAEAGVPGFQARIGDKGAGDVGEGAEDNRAEQVASGPGKAILYD